MSRHLAQTLRALRAARNWSLDRTAEATGVSKAMLGQIERAESSPTIATLWKIASGFQCSLSLFLEPPSTGSHAPLFRSARALRGKLASGEMLVAPIFPYDAQLGFELFELTLQPGYERQSEPHLPGVTEHVIVLQGAMEILVEGKWHPLDAGDAVRFAADRPHGYRNSGSRAATCHNLICYPKNFQPDS